MNRLRYSDARSTIARVMNVCDASTSDTKILPIINEAHARLVSKGKWVGTTQSYRVCVADDACLVWPRQIETIEAWALCSTPGVLRNQWYEFSGNGPGLIDADNNWFTTMIDKGVTVTFDELGTDTLTKRIQVQASVTEAAGSRILLQGYDQNANWIRTLDAGTWVDGEYVSVSTTATLTTNFFTKLVGVQKPVTNGPVRLYEYENATGLQIKQLAYYESDETVPLYRKSFLPGIENMSGCDSDDDCTSKQVTVIAKLRHIDVRVANDYLLIGNIGALKLAVQAVLKEERNLMDEALVYWSAAVAELQSELSSFEGDGAIPILKSESRDIWGPGVATPMDYLYHPWY